MSATQDRLLPFEEEKRGIIVRKRAKTDPKFGCKPEERSTAEFAQTGIVVINKPKGPTSHQVSAYVQKILGIDKAGHSGTLDPAVTGVLPIALGRSTRVVEVLLTAGKEYVGVMHLHDDIPAGKVYAVAQEFTGKLMQLPPIKSAVKRQLREREVYYFDILEVDGRAVLFRVGCQAGTYIRKLVHDLGQKLGCGAHMAELIRTKAGPFSTASQVTLQDLDDAYWYWKEKGQEGFLQKCVLPVERAVAHMPKVWVLDSAVNALCHGALLHIPGIAQLESGIGAGDTVALMTLKGELIALGVSRMTSEQMTVEERGIAVKVEKVFMQPDTYPRIERER